MEAKLLDKLVDRAFDDNRSAPQPAPVAVVADSTSKEADRASIKLLTETATGMVQAVLNRDDKTTPNNSDLMLKVLDIVSKKSEAPPFDFQMMFSPMKAMMEQQQSGYEMQIKMMSAQLDHMQKRIEKSETSGTVTAPKSLLEQIKEAKELLDELGGGRRSSGSIPAPAPEQNLVTTIIENLPEILNSVGQAMAGYAAIQAQQIKAAGLGQQQFMQQPQAPAPPQPINVRPMPGPQAPPQPQPQQPTYQAEPVRAEPSSLPNTEVNLEVLKDGVTEQELQMIAQIYHPLLRAHADVILKYWSGVDDAESADTQGVNLGSWFIDGPSQNEQIHTQLALNPDAIVAVIKSFKPLWDELGKEPDLAAIFIKSFLDRDKIDALQGGDEEEEETVTAPPVPVMVKKAAKDVN